jgi:hypothetical protein
MKLPAYSIRVTLFDPDDESTAITVTVIRVPRSKVVSTHLPIKLMLEQLEDVVSNIEQDAEETSRRRG